MGFRSDLFFVRPATTLREAAALIDRNQRGIALVVDDEERLVGTVVDGDLRRALLAGVALETPVQEILERKAGTVHAAPVTAPAGTDPKRLLALLQERSVRQLPLVDDAGRCVDLVTLDDLAPRGPQVQAVVMAGGFGTRMRPLTEHVPKPMLPVGDKPLLERIIEQLRDSGIQKVSITTHYRAQQIVDHFGSGERFGVEIDYVNEEVPLGTAGALTLLRSPTLPYLVVNGDIVTDLDFRSLLAFHEDHGADMTVGVNQYEFKVPYGVVDADPDGTLRGLREKPVLRFFVNAGIYLLQPEVFGYLESGRHQDMTDLIDRLAADGRKVLTFPLHEMWLDIGHPTDYERAQGLGDRQREKAP